MHKYNFARYYIASCLKRLGFPIAASNAMQSKDKELLRLYAKQIVEQSIRSWTTEHRKNVLITLKELELI